MDWLFFIVLILIWGGYDKLIETLGPNFTGALLILSIVCAFGYMVICRITARVSRRYCTKCGETMMPDEDEDD